MPSGQDMKSSVPLQVSIYFNRYYAVAFFIVMLLLYIYKGIMLPYPPGAIGLEVAFVFFYAIIEWTRLHFATQGNLLELISPTLLSLILAAPVIIFHAYMIQLQTYVLRLDEIINGISLVFIAIEVIFGLGALFTFWKAQRF